MYQLQIKGFAPAISYKLQSIGVLNPTPVKVSKCTTKSNEILMQSSKLISS
jgi:hypothetical protein